MVLNTAVIEEIRETLGEDTLRSFLVRVLAEVEETSDALRKLLAVQDYAMVAATAHRSAGSAASVGAAGLHAALKDIENAARKAESVSALPGLVSALTAQTAQTRAALSNILGSD
jgi:HPt (histidine-containing phosphotransfer) domain-containing protein